ncbi:endonuclease V [Sphingoaurantiacus capsulatus]|uniref:Endonuclease V n=1 Tax=Sphingoaurantiacus capsulatus TaxID=1771310 RepID=A0ABV7X8C4_9SPHN
MPTTPTNWLYPPDLTVATEVQRELASRVIAEDDFGPINTVGGTDISCRPRDPKAQVHAAIVTCDWPSLTRREVATASDLPRFPYVSGYLGFRESPVLVDAFAKLARKPDLLFVDGQGLSHPRGFGIACQLGVLLDVPAIGVGKSVLVGTPAAPLGPDPGDRVPMVWKGRTVGMALRTRPRANPLYISAGHRISLESAVEHVLAATRGYRLPEPTRRAHDAAGELRRSVEGDVAGLIG